MTHRLIIPGRLPGLNEYIEAERSHRQKGAAMKRSEEQKIMWLARSQLRGVHFDGPVHMAYTWVEQDRRRDKDNVSSMGRKLIQDALVKGKILQNDGWKQIAGFEDHFAVDSKQPHAEIIFWSCPPLTKTQEAILFAFAENDMNVSKTARASNYAGSTVRGVLDGVEKKTGLDPRRFFDLVRLIRVYEQGGTA